MLVNLTPHPIRIYGWDVPDRFNLGDHEPQMVIEPSGTVARIGEIELGTQYLQDCPTSVEFVEYRHANGLPPRPEKGSPEWENPTTWYVVSLALALAQAGHRTDLLAPFREVRDLSGTVIGCRSLAHPV
ncbi:hypothetical protein ACQEVC_45430 [Plantactinospora sp. CA-294935]|uniref:hypothetical protein n=1 Tax=Plantactinospora sp. CA-294935 TaxID=3240012 RepID=UPI003D8D2C82